MDEKRVVTHVASWLQKLPETANVRRDYLIFNGGLTPDLIAFNSSGKAIYIVECKGSTNVTGLVQGIGQVYEYFYQKDFNKNLKPGKIALAIPKDIEARLKYLEIPSGVALLLVDNKGRVFSGERRKGKEKYSTELQLPETFYIRDVELNHLDSIIKIVNNISRKTKGRIPTNKIQLAIRKKHRRIAASGFNHLITLRSLGLLDYDNRLSPKGLKVLKMAETSEEKFKQEMCRLFYCFLINVINAILLTADKKRQTLRSIEFTGQELADAICEAWEEKVRFLYDARTVGTVVRILQELGVVKRVGRGSKYRFIKLIHPEYLPW